MKFNFPFMIDEKGRTAKVNEKEHIRQMVEQVLFTKVGERVNRPTYGSGINQLVFAPISDELVTATQLLVQGALIQELGDIISVESVEIESEDTKLHIIVQYKIRRSQQEQIVEFYKGV